MIAERLRQYALLTRLHRPIGILLLLWPTLWGAVDSWQWKTGPGNFDYLCAGGYPNEVSGMCDQ